MNPTHQAALNTLRSAGFFIVVWTPEEVESISEKDLGYMEEHLIAEGEAFIRAHQMTDPEPGICPACSGSGEGMYEGTRCSSCRGNGVESTQHEDNFEEPERDPIYA